MPVKLNLVMADDGSFSLTNATTKQKINYDDKQLLQLLKEVVFQFRGKYPNLTSATPNPYEVPVAPVDLSGKVSLSSGDTSADDEVQQYYNGGLGGPILPEKNLNGFGSDE